MTPKGILSADPMEFLGAMRNKYCTLWRASQSPIEYDWRGCVAELPRLSVEELRSASASFADTTASSYDGIHVKSYQLISDRGLTALATLYAAIEAASRWPAAASLTTVTLIDKKAGGHRGIANFTSLYRMWSKSRKPWAQDWEDRHQRPFFAASRGVGPIDAVYRQALKHEAAVADGLESAVLLEDLESFFESINRGILMEEAVTLGFPLALLRASLAAYIGPRMITLDGRAAREMYARDGIVPGCTFATTFVKLFYMRRLDALVARLPPNIDVDMYIDDLAISGNGTSDRLVEDITSAWRNARAVLVADLGCKIADAKSRVVASSGRVARVIAGKLGIEHAVRRNAPNLGVDTTAGARRRTIRCGGSQRRKRFSIMGRRSRKLARLARTLGGRSIKVFTAGIAPQANYGAEIWGVSDAESTALRRAAARALRPWSRCRSLTTVHLLHGLPTCKEDLRTVVHYAKQVWRAAADKKAAAARDMDLTALRQLWEKAFAGAEQIVSGYSQAKRLGGGAISSREARRAWDAVKGPVGAAALSLARVGWSFRNAFSLTDAHGEEVLLTVTSPSMLTKMLIDASKDECERAVGRAWATTDPSFAGRRVCIDLVAKAIKNGYKDGLTPIQIGALRAAVCNGVYTRSRAVADGYEVPDQCPACGARGDTPHHRVYGCSHTKEAVLRCVPRWVYDEGRRAGPREKFWTTAAFPHPGDDWPRPPAGIEGTWTFASGADAVHLHGRDVCAEENDLHVRHAAPLLADPRQDLGGFIYGDGSCRPSDIKGPGAGGRLLPRGRQRGRHLQGLLLPPPACVPSNLTRQRIRDGGTSEADDHTKSNYILRLPQRGQSRRGASPPRPGPREVICWHQPRQVADG